MSGILSPEVIYDSGFRPNLASARDVLAFMLVPVDVFGPIAPDEYEEVLLMLNEAKRQAFDEWRSLNKR